MVNISPGFADENIHQKCKNESTNILGRLWGLLQIGPKTTSFEIFCQNQLLSFRYARIDSSYSQSTQADNIFRRELTEKSFVNTQTAIAQALESKPAERSIISKKTDEASMESLPGHKSLP